ncbi:hypothetical protein [Undibacterium sp. CCC3.4]|uniref:hypothetical protein n=1 Tax=Undibacterium sp. CCC3.4 TaxID=3048609 RepID=UPI002AC9D1DD|nr:hypothetical protein [Undibacterium sp. CCC3.4]MEB0139975.1 hypothetical protein [Undibacterium sp. CCC2.1]MEB0172948.1 hypothetical protein [Undibacterium sp. CCC1.1]MEB0216878.1 hypothetical protein [Undibacterium sp. 5I2]MEB0176775.1 hypothetical protein [Undibacterium sp. CCC3.4]WPX45014.1 hypothetical protein RHM61_07250 [Undibacterium sp. CCC3.4]
MKNSNMVADCAGAGSPGQIGEEHTLPLVLKEIGARQSNYKESFSATGGEINACAG